MRSISFAKLVMRAALQATPALNLARSAATTASEGTGAVACSAFRPIA